MRRAWAVAVLVPSLVLLQAAQASTGVRVGPARQLVRADQGLASVYVVNAGDQVAKVLPSTWAYTGDEWGQRDVPGLVPGQPFKLGPGEQRTVSVAVPQVQSPCRLVGVGFSVLVPTAEGVVVRGQALAQLALQGRGGTEADCAAILPRPAQEEKGGPISPWWAALLLVPVLGALYGLLRRRNHRRVVPDDFGFR